MMAPAVQPILYPWAVPIPISAMPMVAMVVHELPVTSDTRALMRQAMKRNTDGETTCMP